jgi:hypothetical protein
VLVGEAQCQGLISYRNQASLIASRSFPNIVNKAVNLRPINAQFASFDKLLQIQMRFESHRNGFVYKTSCDRQYLQHDCARPGL